MFRRSNAQHTARYCRFSFKLSADSQIAFPGIGVSGTYVIRQTGTDYTLNFSSTLLVSAIGLLSLLVLTLIYVPLNGFLLTKRWGVFLICCYLVIMSINVVVEVTTHSKKQRG